MKGFSKHLVLLAVALLVVIPSVRAQTLSPGPQVLTHFSPVDDTDQPYALYLPPDFDATRSYPLVVSLHGAGSNHRLNLRRVFGKSNAPGENDVEATRYFPVWEDVDYIVASPYARGTMGYQGVAEKDVLAVLEDVKRRFPIDEDRVYLTGLSMGGGGTLWLGLTRPDLWAAIAPVCPAPPEGAEIYAPNALNLPVHIHQGGADPVVSPESVRAWRDRLEELGTDVGYTEYPGVGHDSWVNAYEDGRIFDWFAQHRREPFPERVRFATNRYENDSAYWVRLDAFTPGTPARIDARFAGVNQIEVTTSELDGFTLELAGHPQYDAGRALAVTVDGDAVEIPAGIPASFRRGELGWASGRYERPARAKRPGAEGPMSEAVADRHIYVYGTADDPSPQEVQARQAEALRAAEWSVYRGPFWGRVMVFPRVVADREVRPSDLETANLVLFGTRETNRLIADNADRLPLHLDPEADYGLAYVFPLGDRYTLVSSGAPWWEAGGADGPQGPFTQAVPALALAAYGDFLLFEGPTGRIVAEGRFDRTWELPEAAAEAIRETGAVTIDEEAAVAPAAR